MEETRYCSNCREELPQNVDACPTCGVYAGDVFEERSRRPRTRRSFLLVLVAVIALTAAMTAWLSMPSRPQLPWQSKPAPVKVTPPEVRVVGDRPGGARRAAGATINEAEAIRLLRRHLATTTTIANRCLVVMSHGPRDGHYFFTAYNRCDHVRIGRWRVDGKTGLVALAK